MNICTDEHAGSAGGSAEIDRDAGEASARSGVGGAMSDGVLAALARWAPSGEGVGEAAERESFLAGLFGVPAQPQRFGRYAVLGVVGKGGMGTVLEAYDRTLERRVAVKVLHEELDESHTIRLLREAQALARLSHPNVVQVYEADTVGGRTFVAMELVEGETIRGWMARHPRPSWRQCVEVFVQVGQGLAAAHAEGLIHRDFKPGNAMIDARGRACVLDFGLARRTRAAPTDGLEPAYAAVVPAAGTDRIVLCGSGLANGAVDETDLDVALTRTGAVPGTVAYMSPEQIEGHEVDERSDQFSFCVSLWEALYGERPFRGRSRAALALAIGSGEVQPAPERRVVPEPLRAILRRGLAANPDRRWASMEDLLVELRALVAPSARRGSAGGRWVGAIVGLVGIATALAVPQVLALQQRCTGASVQLGEVWNDTRRRQLEAAILGTGVSHARSTWVRVEARVDAYAQAWADKHREVCEATSVRHEQTSAVMDLRMGCLHARKVALDAAVGVLAEADSTVVEKAVESAVGLPDISHCDDVEWLEQQGQRVPPPDDPRVAAQVEERRDRLAEIEALCEAGRYGPALEGVERLIEDPTVLGYAPLGAEVELRRAQLHKATGRYHEAEQGLLRAHARALGCGHTAVVLEAAQTLSFVVGVHLLRRAESLVWAETAVHLAEYVGDEVQRARSLGNLSAVFQVHGEYKEAQWRLRRALEIFEATLGAEHIHVGMSVGNLGTVLFSQGEYGEAERHLRRALAIFERALGPMHPRVAMVLDNLGLVATTHGDYEAGMSHHRRALRIFERRHGPGHPIVSYSLVGLAKAALGTGELGVAREHAERALSIREQSEVAAELVAEARFVLARALWEDEPQRGRARRLAERSREVFERGGEGRQEELDEVVRWLRVRRFE